MLARDQLLRQPLADFRRRCIVTADQLDLDPGRQVFLMLLQVEVEPLLALVAGLRDKPCIAVDQPDLDGLRRQRRRQARDGHQQDN